MQLIAERYELLDVIASGGMATVWRARDHRLGRLVALKRPHPGLAGEAARARMEREARAAASLAHPNLVTIYDYGSDAEGPYLVMELLQGPTLLESMGDMGAESAVQLGAQLADGLSAIHEAGIVHRDVKPANVVISARGVPKLTDFGIALQPGTAGDITDPGLVVATPTYAAPEVLRGEEPTAGSDVYSLAVVIEELASASGMAIEEDLEAVLDSAKASTPDDRPTAPELGQALRSLAPTVAIPVAAEGSTLVMDAVPLESDAGVTTRQTGSRLSMWLVALLAALIGVGGLIAIGLALSSDDPSASASPPAVSQDSTTTTITATTTTHTVETTVERVDDLEMALQNLEAVLLQPPRSDINTSEAEDLMKEVEEAIARAEDGKGKDAEKKLNDVAKRIDEKLGEESREEAWETLTEIAALVGIDLERQSDEDDDD